jgi:hypothetical protein
VPGIVFMRIDTAQRLRKGPRLLAAIERFEDALFAHYTVVESARFRSRPCDRYEFASLRSWPILEPGPHSPVNGRQVRNPSCRAEQFRVGCYSRTVGFTKSLQEDPLITVAHIQPIVSLIAGILILIMPQLLNYIVAIYLIIVGITGLGLIH